MIAERVKWRLTKDGKTLLIRVDMEMLIQAVLGNGIDVNTGEGVLNVVMKNLTKREREVFDGLIAGKRNKEIASGLNVCERTVKYFASEIYRKTQVSGRVELLRMINQAQKVV